MATVFKDYSWPNQTYVYNADKSIRLRWTYYSADGRPIQDAEVRWKVAGTDTFGPVVSVGPESSYELPANTWVNNAYVWAVRVYDGVEWSDWISMSADATARGYFEVPSPSLPITMPNLVLPEGQNVLEITSVSAAGTDSTTTSIAYVFLTSTLVKQSNGTWRPVPVKAAEFPGTYQKVVI